MVKIRKENANTMKALKKEWKEREVKWEEEKKQIEAKISKLEMREQGDDKFQERILLLERKEEQRERKEKKNNIIIKGGEITKVESLKNAVE